MPIELKMPALSPTMEEGTLSKWLIKVGDPVNSGDIMAEIETDKATMEFEAVDEGTLAKVLVEEGTENVKVGTIIAMLAEEGEDIGDVSAPENAGASAPAPSSITSPAPQATTDTSTTPEPGAEPASEPAKTQTKGARSTPVAKRIAETKGVDLNKVEGTGPKSKVIKADVKGAESGAAKTAAKGDRVIASPLAKRVAGEKGVAIADVTGTGPGGRIVERDVASFVPADKKAAAPAAKAPKGKPKPDANNAAPYEETKVSGIRKVIARRLTESKQTVPHYYLTIDIRLDKLLALRKDLNASLEPDEIKLSVNDLLIKALAKALMRVPQCNVSFHGDTMRRYSRADISVAVAAPSGLITPVITEADSKSLATISKDMKDLAGKARVGKLMPHEYQGGTASLSNLGMFGIKQFDAVINPPQAMILAVGAGQQQPYVVDGEVVPATVLHASGSFDHRAIDGADGAQLMEAIKQLVENPIGLVL